MENASSVNLTTWVAGQIALLDPPENWTPSWAAASVRVEARMSATTVWASYWRMGAIAATSLLCVALLASPNARVLAEQCWRCVVGGGAVVAPAVSNRAAAPDFSLMDARGATVRLSDYRGKIVLLNFWATWCPPCKAEIPWFVEFERTHKDQGFAVLGVSVDEDGWKSVTPLVEKARVNYRIVISNEEVSRLYAADSLPMTLLIDRQGKIAAKYVGLTDKATFQREIEALLK